MLALAIDTCVLANLQVGNDADEVLTRLDILVNIRRGLISSKVTLLCDFDRKVVGEYYRNLRPDSVERRFVVSAVKYSAFTYVNGSVTNDCLSALVEGSFDPADLVYVGVAQQARGYYVTSEEKHLQIERRALIAANCGISVITLEEADALVRNYIDSSD